MPARSHGASQKKSEFYNEYQTWKAVKRRCYNKNCKDYKDYGAKGIRLSKPWHDFSVFIKDIGKRPSKTHSLDRINGKKGYSKNNCRWATVKEQACNKEYVKLISFKGNTFHLNDWAKFLNIRRSTLWMRIYKYKWPIEIALTKKV